METCLQLLLVSDAFSDDINWHYSYQDVLLIIDNPCLLSPLRGMVECVGVSQHVTFLRYACLIDKKGLRIDDKNKFKAL